MLALYKHERGLPSQQGGVCLITNMGLILAQNMPQGVCVCVGLSVYGGLKFSLG